MKSIEILSVIIITISLLLLYVGFYEIYNSIVSPSGFFLSLSAILGIHLFILGVNLNRPKKWIWYVGIFTFILGIIFGTIIFLPNLSGPFRGIEYPWPGIYLGIWLDYLFLIAFCSISILILVKQKKHFFNPVKR